MSDVEEIHVISLLHLAQGLP